ncbi:hypothetical protein ASPWEDRAFT_175939 [Aspergillus wentii DTO 134E9]|uniref:F-box domain-containing protein n=1 Tax=Aspergillus wentii DTO 134E9 TaxID=1073089 RepID=A0A1L9R7C9_ASPWE|nr:uncharacterized protein ASPWEDRAFT_175939 [Aspergillus wentii DTO 134E9]OJJ30835.1 hypothetical protein ASPWEDRAFT_175939 [Aspergillus wentii DTO 134E9]
MPSLQDLPPELILWVFRSLGNIDDALHLGFSCKRLYGIFDDPANQNDIMKSIIQRPGHHKYDLQLDCLDQFYTDRAKDYVHTAQLSNARCPDAKIIETMQSPSKHLFSSRNVVSGIVRRWHAMKVLFNLYCNSSVRNSYLESYIPYPGRDPESGQDGMPSKNDPLAPPSGDICDDFKKLTPEQKNRTYERFYKVLTAHWVAVEFAWLSKIRIYKDFAERDRFHDEVTEMWTLVEFVWVFLARKIFHSPSPVLEWFDSPQNPFPFQPPFVPGGCQLEGWLGNILGDMELNRVPEILADPMWIRWLSDNFVEEVAEYLRPTHIIELLFLFTWHPQKPWKDSRFEYLRKLGFADGLYGRTLGEDHPYRREARFSIDLLDYAVVPDLAYVGSFEQEELLAKQQKLGFRSPWERIDEDRVYEECENQWFGYRKWKNWALQMRG